MDTKVSDLTIGELLAFLDGRSDKGKITSIQGLADYLGCSLSTANRLKASGRIDGAISQVGRTFTIDKARLDRIISSH